MTSAAAWVTLKIYQQEWKRVIFADPSGACILLQRMSILWRGRQSAPQYHMYHMYHAGLNGPSSPLGCPDSKMKGIVGEWWRLCCKVERRWCRWSRQVPLMNSIGPLIPSLLYRWRAVHSKGNCDIFHFQSNLAIMFPLYLEDEQ